MVFYSCSGFLNESINSELKRDAWIWIVNFLDNTDSFNYSNDLKDIVQDFEELPEKELESINIGIRKWISITDEEMVQEKENFLKAIDVLYNEPYLKLKCMKIANYFKTSATKFMEFDEKFDNALIILSKDYSNIIENRLKFKKVLSSEHRGAQLQTSDILRKNVESYPMFPLYFTIFYYASKYSKYT